MNHEPAATGITVRGVHRMRAMRVGSLLMVGAGLLDACGQPHPSTGPSRFAPDEPRHDAVQASAWVQPGRVETRPVVLKPSPSIPVEPCPLALGGIRVSMVYVPGGAAIELQTEKGSPADLHYQLALIAQQANRGRTDSPAATPVAAGPAFGVPVLASVEPLQDGARLVLKPRVAADLDRLLDELERQTRRMRSAGDCPFLSASAPSGVVPTQ